MTMAAIGITAAVGAGLSMAKAVIQKKPFGSVLTDGLIGGAIGGVTGGAGLGVSSLLSGAVTNTAAPIVSGAVTDAAAQAAAPIVSGATTAATEAASQLATPVLSEVAGQSASTITNLAPTFGQSALEGIGKSAAPSLLAEAPSSSLATELGLGATTSSFESPVSALSNMDKLNVPTISPEVNSIDMGKLGVDIPTANANSALAPEVNSALKNLDNTDPWTRADYTAAINAGSSTLNTGMNLAKSPPSSPANYSQNQYGPQSGASGDSLMNSLINLSRS